jgi:thiol-activated cytolysin
MRRHLLFSLLLVAAACAGEDPAFETSERTAEIDALVRGIDALPTAPPSVEEGEAGAPTDEGDYRCITRPVSETRQHDQLVAFAANSEAMWPGALVRGDSIYSGLFTQIVAPRAPATISVSLENIEGRRSAVMDAPSLSSFREAIASIVAKEVTGATPANIYAEIESISSEEQLAVSLAAKASVTGVPAQVAASFDFSDSEVRSRHLVKYLQTYYTVDLDQPAAPSHVFGSEVTADQLAAVMGEGNPPLYVSSVTFGRIVMFAYESTYSAEEVGAALEFLYSGGADVSGKVSVTYKEILSNARVTAYVLGGSGGDAARSLGSYEEIVEFIRSGGDYNRTSPGAPIAYKLAYLRDNQPARMSFTTEYDRMECERVTQRVLVTLKNIKVVGTGPDDDPDETLEIFGSVQVSGRDSQDLFDVGRADAIEIAQGAVWPTDGFVAERIVAVDPAAGSAIHIDATLTELDKVLQDDPLGSVELAAPYEVGWRREIVLHLTGGGSQVDLTLSLAPI